MQKRFLGCHVSSAGGLENAILNGEILGVNTIQIHPSPPQRWNSQKFLEGSEKKFLEKKKDSNIQKVFFHGIYLINLANPDDSKFHLSKLSLVNYLDLLARISGDGVIFHTGSFKDQVDENEGFERIIKAINWIFEHSENSAKLLLEVSAGSGRVIGSKFSDLAKIYDGVKERSRLGFALDTQHMFGSGYDFKNNLEEIILDLEKTLGLENIKAIHFNDSKVDLASKKDRHENLGEGKIGEEVLKKFLNHKKLQEIPFILETPNLGILETAKIEVKKLKSWAEEV